MDLLKGRVNDISRVYQTPKSEIRSDLKNKIRANLIVKRSLKGCIHVWISIKLNLMRS